MLKRELKRNPNITFEELGKYGIEDIITTPHGEQALIL